MILKALVFDLDGTAIPNSPSGMPSAAVIEAVAEAKKHCHVSIATGRPLEMCSDILEALNIDNLCILNGGSHLYSRKTNEFIWKQEVDEQTLQMIFAQLKAFPQYSVADEKGLNRVALDHYMPTSPRALSCISETSVEDAAKIVSIIRAVEGVTAHAVASWTPGLFDIHISHELATKKHAMQSLLAHLNVNHDQVMVVGDGGNDLPLFEVGGWRVAMGNAAAELKAKADWITPSVDQDGLAVAIRKYILK